MQTGIIGLPQVGKTTLFRILTKANVEGKGGQTTHVGEEDLFSPSSCTNVRGGKGGLI